MSSAKPKILVVDDAPLVLRALDRRLRSAGLSTATCSPLTQPVAQVMADHDIHAVVMDWHLGAGTAAELIELIASTHPNVPVVGHTGDGRAQIEQAGRTAGAFGWVVKGDGHLLEQVQLALDEHQRRAAGDGFPTLDEIQATAVRGAIQRSGGNITAAAQNLGITRHRMRRLIHSLQAG